MASSWIVETRDESFENDVFEASKKQLVIVDFWATWCQPCQMLAPILEEVVNQREGQVILVKAENDYNAKAALQFGVQGIPALFAVGYGKIIGNAKGVMPKKQLEAWLDEQELNFAMVAAESECENNPAKAINLLENIPKLERPPTTLRPLLCRALANAERWEEAEALVEELEKRGFLEPEIESVKTQLELRAQGDVDIQSLESAYQQDASNVEQCVRFAKALASQSDMERAFEILLQYVEKTSGEDRDKAREAMVDLFRVADNEELVSSFRRKLSMALY